MVSKSIIAAIALIAVVSVAGAVVIFDVFSDDGEQAEEYTITYVLNGGVAPDSNPTTYAVGDTTYLSFPSYEGKYFYGWYLDEDYRKSCDIIGKDVSGDITLYAKWYDDLEGIGLRFTVEGETRSLTPYQLSGTQVHRYSFYNGIYDQYYMENSYVLDYKRNNVYISTQNGDNNYWTDDDTSWIQSDKTEIINTVYGKRECVVWTGTNSNGTVEVRYIGDGWIPYFITCEIVGSSPRYLEYTYYEKFEFSTSHEFKVVLYSDIGISATGGTGKLNFGDSVTVTATEEGKTFKGWYNENKELLSEDLTYTFKIMNFKTSLYAMNTEDPDHTFEYGTTLALTEGMTGNFSACSIYDPVRDRSVFNSKSIKEFTFDLPGTYDVLITWNTPQGPSYTYYTVFVTGVFEVSFEWIYDNETYEHSITIDYFDLEEYRNYYTIRERATGSAERNLSFVTYDDPYVIALAAYLKEVADEKNMNDVQRANFLLAFVQYIEYQLDDEYMGHSEYWKFPLETLFDMGGDCEDTSILYCAIATVWGYDTALFLLPGHMAAGIALDDGSGNYFSSGGKNYYFCETTNPKPGYVVGKNPDTLYYNSNVVRIFVVV